MAVLYRKYRPQTFVEVVGQKAIIRTLKNQVAEGSVAHAYLFTGSRGVGKTSLARILAKAVNCENLTHGDPCGKCMICKQIEDGQFLDLVEIDAASNTGVDNIRELIEHVKFSPSLGKFKVFIIDEVHMLSKGAFNALLKTLEEPPKHAIFILATTEINKVPATIISRTQRFDFKRLTQNELLEYLERILRAENTGLHKEIVKLIAENSEGSARDALGLLEKVLTLGQDATAEECRQLLGITDFGLCAGLLELIGTGNMKEIPGFFNSQLERGTDFVIFNRDFLDFLRQVLIYVVTGGQVKDSGNENDKAGDLSQHAKLFTLPELIFIVRLFLKSYKDISFSPRQEIPLLLAALEGAQRKSEIRNPKSEIGSPTVKTSVASTNHQPTVATVESGNQNSEAVASPVIVETQEDAVSLAEVGVWWPKVIEQMKKINQPLANLIRTSPLDSVSGNAIILGVKFNFDKQNLESQKNQAAISALIREVSGKALAVRARVVRAQTPDSVPVTNLGDVLKVFGGELIE